MANRVIFLMSGNGHTPNLVCALVTLRKYYSGRVTVFTWKESLPIVARIAVDPQLDVEYTPWEPLYRGHSDTYVDKTRLIQNLLPNDEQVLFLDADLTVRGSLDPLFDSIAKHGFVATQFNDWVSNGSTIGGRLKTLREFPQIDQSLVDQLLSRAWPSVNSGIFGAMPDSPVLGLWHEWTYAARGTFIPDEKVLHLMMVKFAPLGRFCVADGGRWNCSPKFQPCGLLDEDVVLHHHHGDCNLRPSKCQRAFDMWKPVYEHAMQRNIGGIREWIGDVRNKWLPSLRSEGKLS